MPSSHDAPSVRLLSLRLPPDTDLRDALERIASERGIEAAWVGSVVGSLHDLVIRPAGADQELSLPGPWELLSLGGSLGPDGVHLHVSAADREGLVRGGHVLAGNRVRTTAELALLVPEGVAFRRRHDPRSGYLELAFEA